MNLERILILLLRIAGTTLVLAFGAALLPNGWMRTMHEQVLGMGPFPASPLVEYLTRSIALLYGFHGVLNWLASLDVHRFRPIVVFSAIVNIVHGVGMVLIDVIAGMPLIWILAEGPPIAVLGILLLVILRRIPSGDRPG